MGKPRDPAEVMDMLSWICPDCGCDCAPSDSECPECADLVHAGMVSLAAAVKAELGALPSEIPLQARVSQPAPELSFRKFPLRRSPRLALQPEAIEDAAPLLPSDGVVLGAGGFPFGALSRGPNHVLLPETGSKLIVVPEPQPESEGRSQPALPVDGVSPRWQPLLPVALAPKPTDALLLSPVSEPLLLAAPPPLPVEPEPLPVVEPELELKVTPEPEPPRVAEPEPEALLAVELAPEPVLEPEPESTANPGPAAELQLAPEPEPAAGAEPEALALPVVEPEPLPSVEQSPEPVSELEPQGTTEPEPAAELLVAPKPEVVPEPGPEAGNEPEALPVPIVEAEPLPSVEQSPEPVSELEPQGTTEPEPAAELLVAPKPEVVPEPEPAAGAEHEVLPVPVVEAEPLPSVELAPEPVSELEPQGKREPEPAAELLRARKPEAAPEPGPAAATEPAPVVDSLQNWTRPSIARALASAPPPVTIDATAEALTPTLALPRTPEIVQTDPMSVTQRLSIDIDTDPMSVTQKLPIPVTGPVKPNGPRRRAIPGWLVSLVVATALSLGGAVVVRNMDRAHKSAAPVSVPVADAPAQPQDAFAGFIEVTGLRMIADLKNGSRLHYVVVNHSAAQIANAQLQILVRSGAAPAGAEAAKPLFTVSALITGLAPYESRDMTADIENLNTKEIPDWQFLKPEVRLISQR